MLILTRKSGEIIRIGDAVTVRVLEIRGNQVRLGVEAPGDVRIYREEVYRAIPAGSVELVPGDPAQQADGDGVRIDPIAAFGDLDPQRLDPSPARRPEADARRALAFPLNYLHSLTNLLRFHEAPDPSVSAMSQH